MNKRLKLLLLLTALPLGAVAATVSDNFDAADGAFIHVLDPNWTTTGDGDTYRINSNAVFSDVAGSDQAAVYAGGIGADQYAQVTIAALDGGWLGAAVRGTIAGGAFSGYGIYTNGSETEVFGLSSILASTSAVAWQVGDVIRIEVSGTSITVKRNGTPISQLGTAGVIVDSDIASGQPGIVSYGSSTGTRLDDFEAGDLDDGGEPPSVNLPAISWHLRRMKQ